MNVRTHNMDDTVIELSGWAVKHLSGDAGGELGEVDHNAMGQGRCRGRVDYEDLLYPGPFNNGVLWD